jgi:hypothetical protein
LQIDNKNMFNYLFYSLNDIIKEKTVAILLSTALLCISLTSWYFIPFNLITTLPFTKNWFPLCHSIILVGHTKHSINPSANLSYDQPCNHFNWNDLSLVSSYFVYYLDFSHHLLLYVFFLVSLFCDISGTLFTHSPELWNFR